MIDIKKLAENTFSLKILYVEDDKTLQKETVKLFSNFFHKITIADNGQEGLSHYLKESFDIVISDLHMPMMDGMEMLRHIKLACADQVIIVISAHDDPKYLMEMVNLGIDKFILKPLELQNFSEILHQVHENLKRKALLKQMEQRFRGLHMMEHGVFRFRTIEEVNHLAGMLSNICPKPPLTLQGLLELLTNAVEHGNLGITYEEKTALIQSGELFKEWERRLQLPENQEKFAKVEFLKTKDRIQIRIKDEGDGFEFKKYLEFDKERLFDNHGRGIAMSKSQYFDDLEYLGDGNEVRVIIQL